MQGGSSIDLHKPTRAFIDSTEDPASGPRSANTWSNSWTAPSVLTVVRERERRSGLPFRCRDSRRRHTKTANGYRFVMRASSLFRAARPRANGLQGQPQNNNFNM